ncbi:MULTISPECIES: PKD domain-containing protein [Myroides]|uniref:PKD domain-containing protein n=1 Tax=Myroides TaxID=76831 RepID=UPI0013035F65|nr:PKD domain-containing protein [Myroides phaeus]
MLLKSKIILSLSLVVLATSGCSSSDDSNNTILPPTDPSVPINPTAPVTNFSHVTKVFEFKPAYGQFTNKLPKYEPGDTEQDMIKKALNYVSGKNPSVVSLGAFGGYIVVGFDSPILNVEGFRDFRVLGNAFENNAEPGIIMVAYDKNGDGIPNEDEWYEIKGSGHSLMGTIQNYEITYYKPEKDKDNKTGDFEEYVEWSDNQGNKGWKPKLNYHTQSYFPEWVKEQSISFKGTKLPDHAIQGTNSHWKLPSYEYGYADNLPNDNKNSTIDISWAVDKKGNPVKLPHINFIKVYTGVSQQAGWLGEVSTEFGGIVNLHSTKEFIPNK